MVRKSGFTFIEIMVVVSILLVLLAIGIPVFVHNRAERDLENTQRLVEGLFVQARQTSLNEGPPSTATDPTIPVNACTVSILSAGPPIHCQVIDGNSNVLQDFTGPNSVFLSQIPGNGAQTIFQYDSSGKFAPNSLGQNNVGQFQLSSKATSTVLSFTIYLTTGGVSIP